MENTNVPEVKMPITYDDLKQSLIDSGRDIGESPLQTLVTAL